jgi:hypothetical protein
LCLGSESNLKQIFTEDYFYWRKIFKGYSPEEPPGYSVFRKPLKGDDFPNLTLQILLLKWEGHKFPRNPNAHQFELHWDTVFYGPLVVATNSKEQPYTLDNFTTNDYENLQKLNQQLKKSQISPLDMKNYSKWVPEYHLESPALDIDYNTEFTKMTMVMEYFKKSHSKHNLSSKKPPMVNLESLMEFLDKESFYIYRFKTEMCPNISKKHNYKDCLYFHNPKDYRRKPDFIRYYPENCVNGVNCPNSLNCDMSHSLFETLYHPLKYKVNSWDKIVQDVQSSMLYCIRGERCAFYHDEHDQRKIASNGWKLNWDFDDSRSLFSSASSNWPSLPHEKNKYVPFSGYDETESDASGFQRKHARSHYNVHPPALSKPIAVGISQPKALAGLDQSNIRYQKGMGQNPAYLMTPNQDSCFSISQPKNLSHNDLDEKRSWGNSDSSHSGPIYNNQLFDGSSIPQRHKSNSENAAYFMNKPRGIHNLTTWVTMDSNMFGMQGKSINTPSPRFDAQAVESTTPSSDVKDKKCPSIIESDYFRYCMENYNRNERRAGTVRNTNMHGVNARFQMDGLEHNQPRYRTAHSDFYQQNTDKSSFSLTLQRKITEDWDQEDLSAHNSDYESETEEVPIEKPVRSKMWTRSIGFVPKHLREKETNRPSDELKEQMSFNVNQLVDSTVNSRKNSEVNEEEKLDEKTTPILISGFWK